jgi:hypothetical protein
VIKKIFICIALIIISGLMYATFNVWNQESKNKTLRKQLISSVERIKSCDGKIKIAEILPPRYTELCFQPAYMDQLDFEKRTNREVNGYEILQHDGEVVWWFFENHESGENLLMPQTKNSKSLDIEAGLCFSKEEASLAFDCNANIFIK